MLAKFANLVTLSANYVGLWAQELSTQHAILSACQVVTTYKIVGSNPGVNVIFHVSGDFDQISLRKSSIYTKSKVAIIFTEYFDTAYLQLITLPECFSEENSGPICCAGLPDFSCYNVLKRQN
jgi:D-arabinose 1-dehydrogenase-like Zn-dependent alcohol dehydrogenase